MVDIVDSMPSERIHGAFDDTDTITQTRNLTAGSLLAAMHAAQDKLGWLPVDSLKELAEHLQLPFSQLLAAAEFYSFFHTHPVGRWHIFFSDNITDRMAGSEALMQHMCQRLGVAPDELREDGAVSISRASCIGMADQGPAVLIGKHIFPGVTIARIDEMAALIKQRVPVDNWPLSWQSVQSNLRIPGALFERPIAPGMAIERLLAHGADNILRMIENSGLRGMGGAGFPTANKWAMCRTTDASAHYVICNADEGEPGTFKDRVLLTLRPGMIFEGMTACAYIVGAKRGYLYLRGEYAYMIPELERCLRNRRQAGMLGESIAGLRGFDFDIEIVLGAGAYICGEESALIESIENKRGIPRIRPPYPPVSGLWGMPTVVNNVETFANCTRIIIDGPEEFASQGTQGSKGSKLFSISGDCARPGIYAMPYGTTVTEALVACGGSDACAVQLSGAAGALVSRINFDQPMAFESLPAGGSFMVFGPQRNILEVIASFMQFFAHESCGFCTPCRVGTEMSRQIMERLIAKKSSRADLELLTQLADLMKVASHCGLGQSAGNPILHGLSSFKDWFDPDIKEDFAPMANIHSVKVPL